jgi:hypothetical protein
LLLKCDIHHNLFFDDGKNYVQKASSRAKAVDESVYEGDVERKLRLGGVGVKECEIGAIREKHQGPPIEEPEGVS